LRIAYIDINQQIFIFSKEHDITNSPKNMVKHNSASISSILSPKKEKEKSAEEPNAPTSSSIHAPRQKKSASFFSKSPESPHSSKVKILLLMKAHRKVREMEFYFLL
jgi:hypothetical protein